VLVRQLGSGLDGLQGYLALPHTHGMQGAPVVVSVLSHRAPLRAHQRLEEEMRLVAVLSHPAIVRVHSLHKGPDFTRYLLSEYVTGSSLSQVVTFAALRGKPLSEAFGLYVAAQVADVLHHVHTRTDAQGQPLGILHRDITPDSILLDEQGTVRVQDFAFASSRLPEHLPTSPFLVRGGLGYAAPERLAPGLASRVDARSDLFSLGMVLLEVLTHQHLYDLPEVEQAAQEHALREPVRTEPTLRAEEPSWVSPGELARRATAFRPQDVERVTKGLSAPMRHVLSRLLCPNPIERYATAAQLCEALKECQAAQATDYGPQEALREVSRAEREAARRGGHRATPVRPALPAPRAGSLDDEVSTLDAPGA
jgi:serine/threonine-protein kinase